MIEEEFEHRPVASGIPALAREMERLSLLDQLTQGPALREAVFEWIISYRKNTRKVYLTCLKEFAPWLMKNNLSLETLRAVHVMAYLNYLAERPKRNSDMAPENATQRQQLSAIKSMLGFLEIRGLLDRNAAASVRSPRDAYRSGLGSTPALSQEELAKFFSAFDLEPSRLRLVDLRDHALSALFYFHWPRVEAVSELRARDYYQEGGRWWLRFHEKEDQIHKVQVHPELKELLDAYLEAAGIQDDLDGPLFRAGRGRSESLSRNKIHPNNIRDMIKRRGESVGLAGITPHMFRPTGYKEFRDQGGSREDGQRNFGHAYASTTDRYDRRMEVQRAQEDRIKRLTLRFGAESKDEK